MPNPEEPHKFEPRERGSKLACRWCGATKENRIHTGDEDQDTLKFPKRGGRRRDLIGQALVEMALVTPILLLLVTGVIGAGLWMLDLNRMTHAAQEASVAGAMNPGDSCGVAVVTATKVYPQDLSVVECIVQGQYIEVTLGRYLELQRISPIWGEPVLVSVTAKAVLR